MNVLILHGLNGSDFPHWQAHLAASLVENDATVLFPELPHNDHPSLNGWIDELDEIMNDFSPNVVVCHSLANILWFFYLHKGLLTKKLDKVLLVAPPSLSTTLKDAPEFFPAPLPLLGNCAKDVLLLLSTNDPYLPFEEAQQLAQASNINVKWLENGGHINTAAGFGEWDFPKEWILA